MRQPRVGERACEPIDRWGSFWRGLIWSGHGGASLCGRWVPYAGSVFGIILLLFLVVPIIEIYLVIQVGSSIGVPNTIAVLVAVSIAGAWLLRHQGLSVLSRIQKKLALGEMPGKELVDGLLIAFAGALMLTPGFMTDAFGLLLMLPPTRAIVRTVLMRRFGARIETGGGSFGYQVIDIEPSDD